MPWYAIVALVPMIISMLIIAPLWLILSYKSKKQSNQSLTEEEFYQIQQLATKAEKLADRVQTLEKLLDVESPNWQEKI
ncbi:envelope stress response membrane protein PspB [Catenovulum maritimum]|uniref:Phage-shock protein n=1 Tax=Catenovulum maritimum TaxID=1513271 RepID=A0A0J8GUJ9_9ALTE|nr:envelope stress response membrane protein PspB [Catenovulum maritimum]KMT64358.1 phage-shock protein [Catenovulum maritimum]